MYSTVYLYSLQCTVYMVQYNVHVTERIAILREEVSSARNLDINVQYSVQYSVQYTVQCTVY